MFVDFDGRRCSAAAGPIEDRGVEGWPGDEVVLDRVAGADPAPPGRAWNGYSEIVLDREEFDRAAPGFVDALHGDPLVNAANGRVDADGRRLAANLAVFAPDEAWAISRTWRALARAATAHGGSRDLLDPTRSHTTVTPL